MACVPMAEAFSNEPIPGIDIIIRKCYPCKIMNLQTKTNAGGEFTLKDLAPGQYTIELDGKGLLAAAKAGVTPDVGVALTPLLLPTDKKELAKPMTYRDKATARGIHIEFTVPDTKTRHDYTGTVTLEQ